MHVCHALFSDNTHCISANEKKFVVKYFRSRRGVPDLTDPRRICARPPPVRRDYITTTCPHPPLLHETPRNEEAAVDATTIRDVIYTCILCINVYVYARYYRRFLSVRARVLSRPGDLSRITVHQLFAPLKAFHGAVSLVVCRRRHA